mmetsp:Transcript_9460/g.28470  ORF Transcript_9460/g.28470 Transcript_9460/m.28470 type:complete len:428 (-) Transcript_9460:1867-3150(-)|eukprot:CAMPEP_0206141700 /NCGR_PEP_ID=MMETSP1473-20131121/13835_1 /ASSEMBLY_ACC=CAM_ASM_001109 /TAXON_ID=1461547 /ORGANISM="Stichococcus sp, Strain RCC1054" /LENGTH=427 /DNA_ID=CAMNT_0053536371 /DNA_START=92 /DNA_END=1375 /DNA_ORIENTATION=+
MKVTVKTVKGAATSYEVERDMKVADFKKQIEEKQGADYPADRQKVIFKGVVLKDEQTLAEANVSEQGFLVVMVTKAKAPAAAPAAAPASTPTKTEASAPAASEAPPASTPAAAPAAAESSAAAADPAAAAAAPADAAAGTPADASEALAAGAAGTAGDGSSGDFYTSQASTLSAGPNLESHVSMLVDMGFERAEVQKAMRAAFNNPDRAVEYLMNGIPAHAQQAPPVAAAARGSGALASAGSGGAAVAPASSTAPAASAAPSAGPNTQPLDMFQQGGSGGGGGGPALAFLRNNPQFQGLRQVVQGNPAILQPMLQELGRQNPQLLALINDNQEEFLQMVNEPLPDAEGGEADPALTQMLAGALGEAGMDVDDDDAGVGTIQVTEEEAATIERLQAMGFSREECIQAFFACDKNEDLAMNFLLDSQDM